MIELGQIPAHTDDLMKMQVNYEKGINSKYKKGHEYGSRNAQNIITEQR